MFRQLSDDVTLFLHTGPALGEETLEELDAIGVRVVAGEVAGLEVTDDRLTGVRLATGEVVARQALVVAPRFTARAGFLSSLGLEPVEQRMGDVVMGSAVPADPMGQTAVQGVFVAGNAADLKAQVISAAAAGLAGLNAGAMMNADLLTEDVRLAVAARRQVA